MFADGLKNSSFRTKIQRAIAVLQVAHQNEIERFADELKGSSPAFIAMSCRQLWDEWSRRSSPPWLYEHLDALRKRYDVAIDTE
jgi:hypothetical protein